MIFDVSIVSSEDSDGEGQDFVYYLDEERKRDHPDRTLFFNTDIFHWDEKHIEPSLHTWLVGQIIESTFLGEAEPDNDNL